MELVGSSKFASETSSRLLAVAQERPNQAQAAANQPACRLGMPSNPVPLLVPLDRTPFQPDSWNNHLARYTPVCRKARRRIVHNLLWHIPSHNDHDDGDDAGTQHQPATSSPTTCQVRRDSLETTWKQYSSHVLLKRNRNGVANRGPSFLNLCDIKQLTCHDTTCAIIKFRQVSANLARIAIAEVTKCLKRSGLRSI